MLFSTTCNFYSDKIITPEEKEGGEERMGGEGRRGREDGKRDQKGERR